MPAVKREENTRFMGESFQTKKGYIVRQTWAAPAAAGAASVLAATNSNLVITAGITNPDFPRLLSIVSAGSGHNAAGTVTLNGTDIRGNVISETLTLNGNTTVNSTKAFATVTSVDMTAVTGNDANNTVSVGIGAKLGLNRIAPADTVLSGDADGTKEATVPVITNNSTDISKNVVSFTTAPNGSHNLGVNFVSTELYAKAG